MGLGVPPRAGPGAGSRVAHARSPRVLRSGFSARLTACRVGPGWCLRDSLHFSMPVQTTLARHCSKPRARVPAVQWTSSHSWWASRQLQNHRQLQSGSTEIGKLHIRLTVFFPRELASEPTREGQALSWPHRAGRSASSKREPS